MVDLKKVNAGDIFRLSMSSGYTKRQAEDGMQVMEITDKNITVKCSEDGCMTLTPDRLDLVTDLSTVVRVHYWHSGPEGFEDRRTTHV